MAKKKVTKKKAVSKKKVARKPAVKAKKAKPEAKKGRLLATPSKFRIVTKNLILFVILAILSFILGVVSKSQVYIDFFALLGWILTFIAIAFLISLLVLVFLKAFKK